MTTLAKLAANRRNSLFSTGPKSVDGKSIVARDATRHAIFSSVPVVTGENPKMWEAHRAGVVESLSPVGMLELATFTSSWKTSTMPIDLLAESCQHLFIWAFRAHETSVPIDGATMNSSSTEPGEFEKFVLELPQSKER